MDAPWLLREQVFSWSARPTSRTVQRNYGDVAVRSRLYGSLAPGAKGVQLHFSETSMDGVIAAQAGKNLRSR